MWGYLDVGYSNVTGLWVWKSLGPEETLTTRLPLLVPARARPSLKGDPLAVEAGPLAARGHGPGNVTPSHTAKIKSFGAEIFSRNDANIRKASVLPFGKNFAYCGV